MIKIEIKNFETRIIVELQHSFIASKSSFSDLKEKLSIMNYYLSKDHKSGALYRRCYQLSEINVLNKDINYFKELSCDNYSILYWDLTEFVTGSNYIKD